MKQLALLNRRVRAMWKLEAELPPQERELHSWQFTATQGGVTYLVGKGSANTFFTRVDEGEIEYIDDNNLILHFSSEFSGKAILN